MMSVMAAVLDQSPSLLEIHVQCVYMESQTSLHHWLCAVLVRGRGRLQGSIQDKISGSLDLIFISE